MQARLWRLLFSEDTKAIVDIVQQQGEEMMVIKAAIKANEKRSKKKRTNY